MTPLDHYRRAEALLAFTDKLVETGAVGVDACTVTISMANVHALLALAGQGLPLAART